jgi:hypothetical protein
LADRLETQPDEPRTLAATASQQVQSIIAAAEATAAEIQSDAEKEARAAAEIAERHAEHVRIQATRQAEEYVAKVREATTGMVERQRAIDEELTSLQQSVRSKSTQIDRELGELGSGLEILTTGLGEMSAATATWRTEQSGQTLRSREAEVDSFDGEELEFADEEKARVVALDLALSGTPREEAARFLEENFTVKDPEGLLDDTYSRAGQDKR